jgi:hypothetical protein
MPEAEAKFTRRLLYPILAAVAIAQGGCLLAIAGVAAGGAATGYLYCKGRICRDYPASLPDVRNAVHAALGDLHFMVFTEEAKDGKDFLVTRTTNGKKVRIYLDCVNSPIPAEGLVTRVSIRVATFGDEGISARILDQIGWRLSHGPVPPAPPLPTTPPPSPTPIQQTSGREFETTAPPLAAPVPAKKN